MKRFRNSIAAVLFVLAGNIAVQAESYKQTDLSNYEFEADKVELMPLSPNDFIGKSKKIMGCSMMEIDYTYCFIPENKLNRLQFKKERGVWKRKDVKVEKFRYVYNWDTDKSFEVGENYRPKEGDEVKEVIKLTFADSRDAREFMNKVRALGWEEMSDDAFCDQGDNACDSDTIGVRIALEEENSVNISEY